jgi:hypothetical protein
MSRRKEENKMPLVINAAEGTTATRFLWCVFQELGYRGAHGKSAPGMRMVDCKNGTTHIHQSTLQGRKRSRNPAPFSNLNLVRNCTRTEEWDKFDYVTDSPVAYQIDNMLLSHPDSPVILGLRDPKDWHQKRHDGHLKVGSANWVGAAPCWGGGPGSNGAFDKLMTLSHPDAWIDFIIYNTWVACIVPRESLFVYNLFKSADTDAESNEDIVHRLRKFLVGLGMNTMVTKSDADVVQTCRSSKYVTVSRKHKHKHVKSSNPPSSRPQRPIEPEMSQEEKASAAMKNPHIQRIMRDPAMQQALEEMQKDPESARLHLKNKHIMRKIQNLADAGILEMP